MRISDWSSDVCSSDLTLARLWRRAGRGQLLGADRGGARRAGRIQRYDSIKSGSQFMKWHKQIALAGALAMLGGCAGQAPLAGSGAAPPPAEAFRLSPGDKVKIATFGEERSEEHTSELQSLMRISYAVFCLKKKQNTQHTYQHHIKDK